ncbi:MAG: secondary thiamine-phosphate synthase enzyme YjbQ [Aigarchaeota archaeon]|nr:secondary thiamine-phosphate synthase enzyme YjbQ [Aigarchaeota archaeon]MDW8092301.1 secondary thiamine-phosphate synthase enzyme YjbQ [Nitrososphaerota archaeon]
MIRVFSIDVNTQKRVELVNITRRINEKISEARVRDGVVVVFTRHTTSALIINEDEERLKRDILVLMDRLVPTGAGYRHDEIDNNADAHLRQNLMQPSLTVPIVNGRMALGTWQNVFLFELDGPRTREVTVVLIGE